MGTPFGAFDGPRGGNALGAIERKFTNHREGGRPMGDQKSGPQEAVKGAVEGVKGKAKEVGGTVLGRDDLTEEGQAQQDKADAQRDAGKKEAEAESARAGADAAEEREKKNQ